MRKVKLVVNYVFKVFIVMLILLYIKVINVLKVIIVQKLCLDFVINYVNQVCIILSFRVICYQIVYCVILVIIVFIMEMRNLLIYVVWGFIVLEVIEKLNLV